MYDLTLGATNAIPFVLVDTGGLEVAGLSDAFTVTVSVNGGAFGASAGTKAELSGGWYLYTATAAECATAGTLALKVTAAGCAQQNLVYGVASTAAQLAAIKAKTDTIGAVSVTITSPVAASGAITVLRGDDYLLVDGRELSFTGTNWPSIIGATVVLRVLTPTVTSYSATVTGAAACYVALTDTQTEALTPGVYSYDLQATLSNASVVTLQQGTFTVQADVR